MRMVREMLRMLLLAVLGRADEAWYWLYQSALCRLGEDPEQADAMYERAGRQFEAAQWHAIVERLRHGPDAAEPSDTP